MPEEAGFPPAKRFRPGSGPRSRSGSFPPGRQVVMLLTAGSGGRGGGGGRRQQPPLAQPSASPYPEAVELQRRSLPIFQARGQLLAQLRNLDNAVLIDLETGLEEGSGSPALEALDSPVIVMSATMDVDLFSQYFNGAPVLYLEGRQHPIQVFYTKQPQNDYLHAALVSVFQIHQEAPPSQDILVFLTGQEEIEAMSKTCRDIAKHLPDGCPAMLVLPLYASLPYAQQLRVFQGAPKGYRKVIISTNIAETSITITGIKYVVDTGMVKAKKYNPDSGLEVLAVQRVSKTQAWQRTGRAGREDSGICYRLYTEEEFETFDKMTVPEIQRCNLASVMLQLLAMKVPNVLTFDFMSKPSPDHIQAAIAQLDLLGALEHKDDQLSLTPIGRKMAAFPLEPKFAKTILMSPKFHCTEEILTIVSLLSVDSVLHNPPSRREEVQGVRKKFISSEGDHMTLLNIYRTFKNLGGNKTVPMPPQDTHQPVAIHPSSVLFHCKPACVVYTELLYTNKCYMRDLCVVDAEWLYEAAPEYFRRKLRTARN
ncbi:hypothetical protein H8959_000077 [Pygathrix nigripes]